MSIILDGTSGITSPGGDTATVSVATPIIKSPSSLTLQTNGSTNAVIINTIQNVGLGATPANWGVAGPVLEFKNPGNAVFNNGTSDMWITANYVYNGGWTYGSTNSATGLELTTGGINLFASNSGTAGTTATLTQVLGVNIAKTLTLQGGTQTSGTGIAFPATQSSSSDANTLDDYEEGTWTPTVQGGGTAGTYTLSGASASYTKIGNQVTVWAAFGFSAASGGSSYISIGNLPFSYKSLANFAGGITATNLNTSASSNGMTIVSVSSSSDNKVLPVLTTNNASNTYPQITGVSTSTTFTFTITYQVS